MKVCILGAGALGCLLGGLLAKSGNEVVLVGRGSHLKTIIKQGLRVRGLMEFTVFPEVSSSPVPSDIILLTVKSYDTGSAASIIPLGDNTPVLSLQNGLGNEDVLAAALGPERVMGGATSCGAEQIAPGEVAYNGIGETVFGELTGKHSRRVHDIREMFELAGMQSRLDADVSKIKWEKALVNVGVNPVTAVLKIKNGDLLRGGLIRLCRDALREAHAVAVKEKVNVAPVSDMEKKLYRVVEATSPNYSSMAQDLIKGKRTEIGALNGKVVELASRHDLMVPVNQTLTTLVRYLEDTIV